MPDSQAAATAHKLDADQMEEQLDLYLDPVLSFRRSAAEPARHMSALHSNEQQTGLHWVKIIAATNAEFAYQYAAHFSEAIRYLKHDLQAIEIWTIEAISSFDERGLQLAIKKLNEVREFAEIYFKKQQGFVLEDIEKLLSNFICGLNGRSLKIAVADVSWTDTETIFLPAMISDFPSKKDNLFYYKLLTVYQWAQNWFGTWRYDVRNRLNHYTDPQGALRLFHNFESIRLLYKISDELPGFFRQAEAYLSDFYNLKNNQQWFSVYHQLSHKTAKVEDVFDLVSQYYEHLMPVEFSFEGVLLPGRVQRIKERRLMQERTLFKEVLAAIADEKKQLKDDVADVAQADLEKPESTFDVRLIDEDLSGNIIFELSLDGKIIVPADDVQHLMSSIFQDIGEIPEEYLVAAGPGKYVRDTSASQLKKPEDVWSGVYHEEGACFYDEWDHIRQHYKKNWCVVRELSITPVHDDFVTQTLNNNIGLVKSLRRHFEALKGEDKLLKRQLNGDDIDIDALVESFAELTMGMELNERVFTKTQRLERNIAVMFLVDMSGSTKGWINQAEREALVLLCESLEILGDRYAIYGFSGTTRKRCEIYHIKHIDEDYSEQVKARISGITAKDYTRMGFAIRHLTKLLEQLEAKTKLLISLSDGKPEDYDGLYRGEYGIEDTRQSLFEAQRKGIHSFCITIDKEAGDYLPHMYGAGNYALIEDINTLPFKVSDIYRKLTS